MTKKAKMIDLFIPSYKRPQNLKTVKFFCKIGYDPKKIHVFIDSEAEDKTDYEASCKAFGVNLIVFDMNEARERYDYVHRPSQSRRSAGQARNQFYDYAKEKGIKHFIIQDDDTDHFHKKKFGKYKGMAKADDILTAFNLVMDFVKRNKIGLFGISQTGDYIGGENKYIFKPKVMNTTFVNTDFIYRGERGIQDNDTSQFTSILNFGLFTGQINDGVVLKQTASAKQKGGLTELYNEAKLLNKALVCVIQYPSAIKANKQEKNGGRIHHSIRSRYLMPRIIKDKHSNIAWDTYPEDFPFTLEPNRKKHGSKENLQ